MKKEEGPVFTELFRDMISASPMGVVVWGLKNKEWVLYYANENATQFLPVSRQKGAEASIQSELSNLGKVDLTKLFARVLNTREPQELIIKHSLAHCRAQVFLMPLGENYVISYYMNIDPLIRKENELKTAIHQLHQFNSNMSGREDELIDLEKKMKALKLKLKLITTKKSLSFFREK